MSQLGQNAKYSLRAYVFCFGPNNGHRSIGPAYPFGANFRIRIFTQNRFEVLTWITSVALAACAASNQNGATRMINLERSRGRGAAPTAIIVSACGEINLAAAYLKSAGPRQLWDWGSRTRPLPQPPTRSLEVRLGIEMLGSEGAIPAVTNGRGSGLRRAPAACELDHVGIVRATTKTRKRRRHIRSLPQNLG